MVELTPEKLKQFTAVLDEIEKYRTLTTKEKEMIVKEILSSEYLDLRCDWAFKYVMQNLDILKMLLNDFIPEQIDSVEILPNEIGRLTADDKNVIMDVVCMTDDGRRFIVEMQRKKKDSFLNRMLYYGASMLYNQLKPGEDYDTLVPVYVICFMDYTLEHVTDQLVYRYMLKEKDSGELYGELLSIYLCELPRLKVHSIKGLNPVESWFYILENLGKFAGKPEEIGARYAPVATAARTRKLPDVEQLQYIRAMVSEHEKLDIGKAYYKDGFKDGFKDGKKEVAIAMKKFGLSLEDICSITGLTPKDVQDLSS